MLLLLIKVYGIFLHAEICRFKSTAQEMRDIQRGSNGALIKPEVMNYYEKKGEALLEDLRTGRLEIAGSRRLQMP